MSTKPHTAIMYKQYATVRVADLGVTDFEWEVGCRVIDSDTSKQDILFHLTNTKAFTILTDLEWSELMRSLRDENDLPKDRFISTYFRKDKWDGHIPIY